MAGSEWSPLSHLNHTALAEGTVKNRCEIDVKVPTDDEVTGIVPHHVRLQFFEGLTVVVIQDQQSRLGLPSQVLLAVLSWCGISPKSVETFELAHASSILRRSYLSIVRSPDEQSVSRRRWNRTAPCATPAGLLAPSDNPGKTNTRAVGDPSSSDARSATSAGTAGAASGPIAPMACAVNSLTRASESARAAMRASRHPRMSSLASWVRTTLPRRRSGTARHSVDPNVRIGQPPIQRGKS